MTSGISSLNPHAVSYIPLAKRVVTDIKNISFLEGTTKTAGISNTTLSVSHGAQGQYQKSIYDLHESESVPSSGDIASRSHPAAAHGSSSQNPTVFSDNQMSDMEFEMDMDYLQMSFPNLSHQFIVDVYLENDRDLESAVDMLNHIEVNTFT